MGVANIDGSPWRQRRENGERNENMTMTLQYVCVMYMVGFFELESPLRPPTHSASIDFIIMIISDDSDHHTRS